MESPAIQSESLVCDSKVCWYLSRKRVELLGSVIWNGDSTHQSLNTMGKLIAKKYREGKIKSTLKKEWKQTWNDIVGTDYSFNWPWRVQISVASKSCLDISNKMDGVSQKCIWNGRKGHELRSIHERLFQAFAKHKMARVNVKDVPWTWRKRPQFDKSGTDTQNVWIDLILFPDG